MKPLKQCPGCQEPMIESNINRLIYERCEKYCSLDYYQYFEKSIKDEELSYITFHTKDFYIYSYFKQQYSLPAGITHVYHNIFPRGESSQSPFIKLTNLIIDFNNLDVLNNKLLTYSTFS